MLLVSIMRHHYVRNVDLTAEIVRCQIDMVVSDKLAAMLWLLVERYALNPNWRHYSYIEDMKAEALLQLVKRNEQHREGSNDFRPNILKFDLSYSERTGKKPNPFSYATQIVANCFRRFVKLEGALQRFRDDCLIEQGAAPSNKRQFEDECNWSSEPLAPQRRPPPKRSPGRPKKAAVESCHHP